LQVRRTGHLKHQARTRSQTLTMVMDEDKTNIQSQTSFIIHRTDSLCSVSFYRILKLCVR
ncbi:MAG TPA: hypothetical protein PK870_03240, partial [Clostridia bacterium]|nr:hypothetical protein [Clostridia bacterium]